MFYTCQKSGSVAYTTVYVKMYGKDTIMNTLSSYIALPMQNTTAKNILLAFLGSVLIGICAQITVPMVPVPMTLQTFAVLTVAMGLGARYGALSVLFYLAEGAMGLPVFAGGKAGLVVFTMGTGGYLIGFVIAAYIVGYMAEKGWDRSFIKASVAMFIGNVALYIPGVLWLGVLLGWNKSILTLGLTPFILGDLVKLVVASGMFSVVWSKLK